MKSLFIIFCGLFISVSIHAQKLHVLFVIDGEDTNFGLMQLRNESDILSILEIVERELLHPSILGDRAAPAKWAPQGPAAAWSAKSAETPTKSTPHSAFGDADLPHG